MILLESVLKISLQNILKTSWRRLQNVLKISWRCREDVFVRLLKDVLKTSWRRLSKTSWTCFVDVLKTYWSWPLRLEDVWLRRIYLCWSRRLEDVFKISSARRLFAEKSWKYYYLFFLLIETVMWNSENLSWKLNMK